MPGPFARYVNGCSFSDTEKLQQRCTVSGLTGARKLVKARNTGRIDGLVAATMAIGAAVKVVPKKPSVYQTWADLALGLALVRASNDCQFGATRWAHFLDHPVGDQGERAIGAKNRSKTLRDLCCEHRKLGIAHFSDVLLCDRHDTPLNLPPRALYAAADASTRM